MIILNVLLLVLGMFFMIKGADFFVEGSSNIAKLLKIPSLIIGLTLVSIGTSAPELSVSIQSSLALNTDLSFGNVIGSNIFNVLIVIGASALFTTLVVSKEVEKIDIPILLGVYALLLVFAFVVSPLQIELWEGIVIFSLFIIYTAYLIIRAKLNPSQEEEKDDEKKKPWWLNLILVAVGLAGIIVGGDFVVDNASEIATTLGMSEMLVGLTIVAIGTSLPELVTSMVAAKKGENDIAIGNAIGSCLFNIVLILGTASMICPVGLELVQLVDVIVMIVSVLLVFLFAFKSYKIKKWQGILLIAIYIVYFVYIILRNYM